VADEISSTYPSPEFVLTAEVEVEVNLRPRHFATCYIALAPTTHKTTLPIVALLLRVDLFLSNSRFRASAWQ
jgi:hypothetical protein